jgi:hypothetical protein
MCDASPASLNTLPRDVIGLILPLATEVLSDWLNLRRVCKKWHRLLCLETYKRYSRKSRFYEALAPKLPNRLSYGISDLCNVITNPRCRTRKDVFVREYIYGMSDNIPFGAKGKTAWVKFYTKPITMYIIGKVIYGAVDYLGHLIHNAEPNRPIAVVYNIIDELTTADDVDACDLATSNADIDRLYQSIHTGDIIDQIYSADTKALQQQLLESMIVMWPYYKSSLITYNTVQRCRTRIRKHNVIAPSQVNIINAFEFYVMKNVWLPYEITETAWELDVYTLCYYETLSDDPWNDRDSRSPKNQPMYSVKNKSVDKKDSDNSGDDITGKRI